MTTATEWDEALDELRERGARWAALRPYCEALVPVVERLRVDSRVGTVVLQVSHATLVIGVTGRDRSVGLGWNPPDQYQVFFVDAYFEFVDLRCVTQGEAVEVVIHYLDQVRRLSG